MHQFAVFIQPYVVPSFSKACYEEHCSSFLVNTDCVIILALLTRHHMAKSMWTPAHYTNICAYWTSLLDCCGNRWPGPQLTLQFNAALFTWAAMGALCSLLEFPHRKLMKSCFWTSLCAQDRDFTKSECNLYMMFA